MAEVYLTDEEKRQFKQADDTKAWLGFITTWGLIAAAMMMVAIFPNVLTVILAMFIIGGRQLALGILLHDCSHRSWFSSQKMNDFMGHWFAGVPVLVSMDFYRPYHFLHHTKTGTEQDPDVENIRGYPVSPSSFKRKVFRDFTLQSGLKSILAMLLYVNTGRVGNARAMGVQKKSKTQQEIIQTTIKNYSHILLFHGLFFFILWSLGQPWLYLLWWGSYVITYPFISRVRQVAEHGAMTQLSGEDVRLTTRTTLARWWDRFLFAPHFVNYHCEHHYLPTVAGYNLPEVHQLLKQRGFYQDHPAAIADGYGEVIKRATSA